MKKIDIKEIKGFRIGNAEDVTAATGVTVIIAENGAVATHADDVISVAADENISILGFGSGDPKPLYSYTETETKLFNGRALLVVQKKDFTRNAVVTVTGKNGCISLSI